MKMLDTIMSWVGYSPTAQLTLAQTLIAGLESLSANLNLVIVGMFILVLVLVVALWRRPMPVYVSAAPTECCQTPPEKVEKSKPEVKVEKSKSEVKVEKSKPEVKVETKTQ